MVLKIPEEILENNTSYFFFARARVLLFITSIYHIITLNLHHFPYAFTLLHYFLLPFGQAIAF